MVRAGGGGTGGGPDGIGSVMLPFEGRRRPFAQGWWWLAIALWGITLALSQALVAAVGADPDSRSAAGWGAAALAVGALAGYVGGRRFQAWDAERRADRYEQDRLPELKRVAALEEYRKGEHDDLEDAWQSVQQPAMEWFATEMRIVREVHRDYHRFLWLPVHHVVPGALALFAVAVGLQAATGLGG